MLESNTLAYVAQSHIYLILLVFKISPSCVILVTFNPFHSQSLPNPTQSQERKKKLPGNKDPFDKSA